MHQIGVVGLSYRHAGVDQVARFAVPRVELPARLPQLRTHLQAAEVVYVGTCNRVEIVYATHDGGPAARRRDEVFHVLTGREPAPGEATRVLRAWTGEAAVEHLLLLACGLDSAQTGEHEIAAQLRGAWEDARVAHTCGPVLDRLVGESLAMARRVRRLSAGTRAPPWATSPPQRVLQHLNGGRRPRGTGRRLAHDTPLRHGRCSCARAAAHRQPHAAGGRRAGARRGGARPCRSSSSAAARGRWPRWCWPPAAGSRCSTRRALDAPAGRGGRCAAASSTSACRPTWSLTAARAPGSPGSACTI